MKIVAVSTSRVKGVKKENQKEIKVIKNFGVENDAHAGPNNEKREISLLALESIELMNKNDNQNLKPGDFGENITIQGLSLHTCPIGTKFKIGNEVVLKLSQIGKKCHHGCAIKQEVGHCIMPSQGIFAKVISEGLIKPNDIIEFIL